ncbi:carboxymethylenebutenolidase [Amycolatopsis arida]|uniref:Carboxymethylenebutenolidase n=1 Tax=Amycolatopsis arida TaxID=587909 RepID=A0A1I5YGB9_9PSEU|nr:dienelactone hydrolase family protein [Amycolatopsis arida]TDX90492.1 carboxymethylenebutenolidase [Amycolatopsis arida]SFQ43233.1 carboxymethylenebutenolidase [Amycolatopsis arida]
MTQTHTVDYERPDGGARRLTYAEPDGAVRGGLVVLHEAEGVNDGVLLLLGGLAGEGWLAVAPHLAVSDTGPGSAEVLDATDGALAWLTGRGIQADLLGVIGFDLGGTAAFVVATRRTLGAAVSVSPVGITRAVAGDLPPLVDIAAELSCPWLGIHGDTGDEADEAEVERLREATSAAAVATNVVRYPGANHRFDADPAAAEEAWQRALDWFDAHLR